MKEEILRAYEELIKGEFYFMGGICPIPDLTKKLIKKGFTKEDIHKTLIEMYYRDEITLDYGDKKDELSLKSPYSWKEFYYMKVRRKK